MNAGAIEIATRSTATWIRPLLPPPPARLLEVGSGRGELALHFQNEGFRVVALDASSEAVEATRSRGVREVRLATFPDFESEEPFEAVLFTRSLHHIERLEAALDTTSRLLVPGGLVLVEDFSWEHADARTLSWAEGTLGLLAEAGIARLEALRDGLFANWHADHAAHDHHTLERMVRAVEPRFEVGGIESAPYLFRYFCVALDGRSDGESLARRALGLESELIRSEAITGIGRRLWCRKRGAGA